MDKQFIMIRFFLLILYLLFCLSLTNPVKAETYGSEEEFLNEIDPNKIVESISNTKSLKVGVNLKEIPLMNNEKDIKALGIEFFIGIYNLIKDLIIKNKLLITVIGILSLTLMIRNIKNNDIKEGDDLV